MKRTRNRRTCSRVYIKSKTNLLPTFFFPSKTDLSIVVRVRTRSLAILRRIIPECCAISRNLRSKSRDVYPSVDSTNRNSNWNSNGVIEVNEVNEVWLEELY